MLNEGDRSELNLADLAQANATMAETTIAYLQGGGIRDTI
jgi:hypothetical protein